MLNFSVLPLVQALCLPVWAASPLAGMCATFHEYGPSRALLTSSASRPFAACTADGVNEHGRYVLNGVPEGANTVEVRVLGTLAKKPITRTVSVPAYGLATNINFDLNKPSSPGTRNIKPIQGKGG